MHSRGIPTLVGRTFDQPAQISLLLAQEELSWPPVDEREVGRHAMVVNKRLFNSFCREDEFSAVDAVEDVQRREGDFTAHFVAKRSYKYDLMFRLVETVNFILASCKLDASFPFAASGLEI